MSYENAYGYLSSRGFGDRVRLFEVSSATVALAAQALGCSEGEIAKTLAFDQAGRTVLILAAGDVKVDNHKYKETFHMKAKMLSHDETAERVGHPVGGVPPGHQQPHPGGPGQGHRPEGGPAGGLGAAAPGRCFRDKIAEPPKSGCGSGKDIV